jgi:hypothetical protein
MRAKSTPAAKPAIMIGTVITNCQFTVDNKTNEHDAAVVIALAHAVESNASALQAIAEAYRYHGPANATGLHITSEASK